MKVLIACEFSGVVRDAFLARGHDAYSCDILPTESKIPNRHHQCDVREILDDGWEMMIAHPPCTRLAVSGARWFKGKEKEQEEALEFVRCLMDAPINRIAIENPVSVISTRIRKPDQITDSWWFGHGETKKTCWWLTNLPLLRPTKIVHGRKGRIHHESPGPDRWKRRSRMLPGIGNALAKQWGALLDPSVVRVG